ncbi:MAG: Trm112 family protein [Calditrichaeota bacterium]|nr:MAG: Trm112 family protein [Calditrichota bacterium]
MLKKELLDILACPKCKGELEYQVDPNDDRFGKLICQACALAYRVEEDIPVMLIEEAEPLGETSHSG